MDPTALLIIHLVSTWYMVGLIWMVQIVHYAMFDRVGAEQFVVYATEHARRITPIVGPPMIVEMITAILLLKYAPEQYPFAVSVLGIALLIVIWLSTMFLQVPCHSKLASGFDLKVYRRLVGSNWVRTVLWSVRGLLIAYVSYRVIR